MIENADFYQYGTGWCVSRALTSVRSSDVIPSTGIYYFVLLPTGWKLAVHRDADSGKALLHAEFWAEELCELFGRLWSRALVGRRLAAHARTLANNPHCFPRGRVEKDGDAYMIYHGHDQKSTPEGLWREIELIFGVAGFAKWVEDGGERCRHDDREAVRKVLQQGVAWLYWPAV